MRGPAHLLAGVVSAGVLLTACGTVLPQGQPGAGPPAAGQPKRIAAVVMKGGEPFRDPARGNLSVEVRAGSRGDEPQSLQAVAEYWKRIGVEVDTVITQQRGDREYTAAFPAFLIRRYTDDPNRVTEFPSTEIPLPDNRFRGRNTPRYSSAELDGLLERFTVTIPRRERTEIFGDILHHLSDQLVLLPLFYNAGVTLISHRMEQVSPRTSTTQAWKAYTWDVK